MTNATQPRIEVLPSREAMGAAAARHFRELVLKTLEAKPLCRVVFACAPSQNEFLGSLVKDARTQPDVWRKVEVFHMDEYVGLSDRNPQSFRNYLRRRFLDHIEPARSHLIRGEVASPAAEAARYATLIGKKEIDVIALGIGENGHVAFNDPPVANFTDPVLAKVVELDEGCRQQQVNDRCFPDIQSVPRLAITLTVPVFARAKHLCAVVPGPRKARAVRDALRAPVGPACPATVLRVNPNATLFLDRDSAALLH